MKINYILYLFIAQWLTKMDYALMALTKSNPAVIDLGGRAMIKQVRKNTLSNTNFIIHLNNYIIPKSEAVEVFIFCTWYSLATNGSGRKFKRSGQFIFSAIQRIEMHKAN